MTGEIGKILVTGGTGFTGSHLVQRLLERGEAVRVLDKSPGIFRDELEAAGAEIRIGSVTDEDEVREAVRGCRVVFHLAAAFRDVMASREVYWDVNVRGVERVAEASLAEGVERFVYCSTEGVHGLVEDPPGTESSPVNPQDYYEYTKWEGERALAPIAEKGLPTVVLRPTAIYGPGDPERFYMIFRRVASGIFPMFGDGTTSYHPVYIDNLVQAFELSMDREEAVGGVYLIGDEDCHSIEHLVRAAARAIHAEVRIPHFPFWMLWVPSVVCEAVCRPFRLRPPLFPRRADWFRKTRAFDISHAKKELGYAPLVDLDEGLRRTAAWYIERGMLPGVSADGPS
ncbi:MAG: NAD-dependent epimerase/dehydratase family protein [Gemmatimonadota bacterium]|nr:NAD-dependent epimerase/dehydratase family protein [Gemmatimonadota bacterium]MDP6802765.1 NAD-dependent epimerase/dehydratase family protein [Gemmatimonadota bacterium]MDP7032111.1 NAD-dependent epimerase/dehydratase family protein [Gemmatimonadota bacterium]